MHSNSLKEKALDLRKEGYSYSHISNLTGLSKSTLSGWLSDIPYVPNQQTIDRVGKAIAAANAKKVALKIENIRAIQSSAKREIGNMNKRDLFMFGLGLYLGEGSKTHDTTRIVNADPRVINSAIAWFRGLGVEDEQFSLRVHLYPDSNLEESLSFWSRETGISRTQFKKTQIDARTNKLVRKAGKLPYGTAHLSVKSLGRKEFGVILARKIQAWTDEAARCSKAGLV